MWRKERAKRPADESIVARVFRGCWRHSQSVSPTGALILSVDDIVSTHFRMFRKRAQRLITPEHGRTEAQVINSGNREHGSTYKCC